MSGFGRYPGKSSRWIDALELPQLAAHLGVSKDVVHRAWKKAGLKPHRIERYLASDDPDFESKGADIIGLYLIRRSTLQCSAWMKRQ